MADRQKEFAKRKQAIECRRIQEQQAQETAKRRAAEQAQRLSEEKATLRKQKEEVDIFEQFCLAEIARFEARGKAGADLLKKAITSK